MSEKTKAAELILDTLSGKIPIEKALSDFPKSDDINVKCAFDALMHREADEDQRKDIDYKTLQDEYLEDLARILEKDEPLPKNIIANYLEYHEDNLIEKRDVFKNLKKMINF